jgi:surface polysaccharide O-acyltransferase-like enzyme
LLVIFNVLPLPADPIRWLAIISQYSLTKYFLAQWVGRFIRYAILATVAKSLKLTFVQIIIICTALFVISGLIALVQRFRQRGVESNVAEKASA